MPEVAEATLSARANAPIILNLGCGTRTSEAMINIDFSPYLRIRRHRVAARLADRVLDGQRLRQFRALGCDQTLVHDLRRGIPFPDESVDAVYHSHLLEHIDRTAVPDFLREVHRVLKPGGVHRVVVPDLETLAESYLESLNRCRESPCYVADHDTTVAAMIEQMVRREAFGTARQRPLRRWIENRILGDARSRNETHQWMWDELNLAAVLVAAGFHSISRVGHDTSAIHGWNRIGLDSSFSGHPYKPGSLYLEACR